MQPDTLRRLIYDICEALVKDGFDHVLLVNSHQTNEPIMEHAGRPIREKYGVIMGYINPVVLAEKSTQDLYPKLGSAHGHGDERVTSMLSYCLPGALRMDAPPEPQEWREFRDCRPAASHQVKVGQGVFGLYIEVIISHYPVATATRLQSTSTKAPRWCGASWAWPSSTSKRFSSCERRNGRRLFPVGARRFIGNLVLALSAAISAHPALAQEYR